MKRLVITLILATALGACGDSSSVAPDAGVLSLTILSGDNQTGEVETELPEPLTILLEESVRNKTKPVAGTLVNFVITQGGGSVYAGAALTDADGRAAEYWTLGPTPGTNRLEARAVTGMGEKLVYDVFTAWAELPEVVSVVVEPEAVSFRALGATEQLTAVGYRASGLEIPGVTFQWTSSNEEVATVSSTGMVEAVGNGSAAIRATEPGGAYGEAAIAVAQEVASVTVEPGAVSLGALGATEQLAAIGYDASGSEVSGVTFDWTSSNDAVATVGSAGMVEAVANGSATITATALGGALGEASVTVEQVVATLVLDPDTMTFFTRLDSRPIAVAAYDALGSYVPGVTIVWTSSDEDVAYVSEGSVHSGYTGEAVLTAMAPGGVSATVRITVHQVVTHVIVWPNHMTLTLLGATQRLSASAYDASLSDVFDATFEWASSDESVATVTSDGLVEAVGSGAATITATESETGEYAEATITVEVGTPLALTVAKASVAPASIVRPPKAVESRSPLRRLP
jgi:uncharacterized protein YjdB